MAHGRKSAATRSMAPVTRKLELPEPPAMLAPAARALWVSIIQSRAPNFFNAGDLALLREYCHTIETIVPSLNDAVAEGDLKALDRRDKHLRLAASLAGKLRICVSSRTRPDTASMRDSDRRKIPPWVQEKDGKPI